ncbi:helix-turn-helix domain-containing protein [Fenollaria sporofastidiosus]|uniref:helix-turn-helix domain-containing protein n=1 Tax=Fenollaria sporofastidiosus TaxID=2811778 RepID=UPI001C00418B|nr:helix-turn-helix transcriptional regulator [Fenollaria sporofastidiosus]
MNFAMKLKRLRERAGLTQTELAEQLGLSLKTISRYEVNGMRPRSRQTYNDMANIFRVDASYLLVDDDDYKVPVQDQNYDMLVNGMIGLFAGGTLSDEDKKAVVEAITEAYYKSKYQNADKKEGSKN